MSNNIVESPKYFVAENTWKIKLNYPDGKTETLVGMPDSITAYQNYEALKRYLANTRQRS